MKNLLLISYSFPPARNVGALRPRGIAKYLPYYGWKVFVLTPLLGIPRDSQYNMVETYPPFRERMGYLRKKLYFDFSQIISHPPLYKIFLSNFSEIVPFPDTKKGWVVHGVYAGKYVIEKESISAIISTCSPISCHTIAHKLKKIFPQLVWVADFRDLWAHNPFHKHTRPTQFLKETVEKKLLENADFITTVSEPLADHLRRFHNKETFSIPNGFDPDEYNFDAQVDQKFSITYTGSIYPEERDPELLFIALRKLISGDSRIEEDIEVNFFCRYNAALDELIRKYNLDKVVHQNGIVARENVIKIQKSSHILLLLLPEDKGVYTGKLFEYLGAKRPVLAIGYNQSVVKNLLEETGAGIFCWEEQQVYQTLKIWYQEWKTRKIIRFKGNDEIIDKYSHKSMAEKFASILKV